MLRPSTPITGRDGSAQRMVWWTYRSHASEWNAFSLLPRMRDSLPLSHAAIAFFALRRETMHSR